MGTHVHKPGITPLPPAILSDWKLLSFTPRLPAAKKKLIRRRDCDYSQALRRGYQFAFLLMNVWLGGQFYLWVRHYETAGTSAHVSRPAGERAGCPSQA
jgi:hypothetical protein